MAKGTTPGQEDHAARPLDATVEVGAQTATIPGGPGDDELVRGVRAGDRAAVAAIYDRYADLLYDFCWSLLRDRAQAAAATEQTLVAAMRQLEEVGDAQSLRPWLYAMAHRQVLDRLRTDREGAGAAVEMADLIAAGGNLKGAPDRGQQREVVWRAAAALSEPDQALLTLHLRHELAEAEVGEVLAVEEPGQAGMLLSRLRDQVERSLGALLVCGLGHRDCPDLVRLLGEQESSLALVRKRVTRHVDRCETCTGHRRKLQPLALLAAVPLQTAPPQLRERVLGRMELYAEQILALRRPSRRWGLPLAAVLALLALVLTGLIVWDQEHRPAAAPSASPRRGQGVGVGPVSSATVPGATVPPSTAAASSTSSLTTTSSSSTSSTSSTVVAGPAGALAVSPGAVSLGAQAQTATLTLRNTGAAPLQWTAASSAPWLGVAPGGGRLDQGGTATLTLTADRGAQPEGSLQGAVVLTAGGQQQRVTVAGTVERAPSVGASASPTRIRTLALCGATTATVTATVSDESAVSRVVLEWGSPATRTSMARRNGAWQAQVGPASRAGTLPWRVTATDSRGNSASASGSVRVDSCLLL